jgi:signal transduction histidine kinase
MKTIKTLLIKLSEKLLSFFIQWRRLFFIPFFLILAFMEAREITDDEPIHALELVIYYALIIVIALLVELFLRAIRLQNRVVKTLDYKHQINRELITHENWESLANRLVELLAKMADFKQAQLFLWESVSQRFSLLSQWPMSDADTDSVTFTPKCQNCSKLMETNKGEIRSCHAFDAGAASEAQEYCLPVYYQDEIFALVRFKAEPGQVITREQKKILGNLGDEIAIAITAGQDRNRLLEIQITETALAERHKVSQYLHDNLGQNIGYLRMRLEQFASNPAILQEDKVNTEILRMKETAEEAYAIVRNKLETIHTTTLPVLESNLREHASRVSERAGFEFTFTISGHPKPISMEVQRAVFYVFQETLSNVEKHAKAAKVDIALGWSRDKLTLTVSDNGVGFNPRLVDLDKHFGLGIVRERIKNVSGRIEVNSEVNSGTTIKVRVPLSSTRRNGHT